VNYLGDFSEDATVRVVLTTNNGDGAAVAPSSAFEAADFVIYKNGSATQKSTTNGITISSPFDSVTGLHTLEIDTSNDTGDSGFWTTAADYWVVATPDETIDSQAVVAVIATFSIQNRYSSARLAAIEEDTLDIQSRLPATLDSGNMRSSVQSMANNVLTAAALASDAVTEIQSGLATTVAVAAAFTEIKGAGWSASTDTLEEIADAIAGISSGTGGGARTVTITVNDGTNPLQNAKVRVTQGAESYLGTTNASGVVTFNLDDATWTVAITKPGYTYAGTTLVVDGNESATYSMTAVTITPSSGSLVTGYWVCYSELGVVESGVTITMQAAKVPADTGFALDSAVRTSTSGSDGIAQFTNLIPGATYRVQRNSGDFYTIKIDDDATGSVELNSILGT
jgi:hypothetical protein